MVFSPSYVCSCTQGDRLSSSGTTLEHFRRLFQQSTASVDKTVDNSSLFTRSASNDEAPFELLS